METRALSRLSHRMPSLFGDLSASTLNAPAINILDEDNHYMVTLAVPGMKKNDFKIEVDGNILTSSSEKEESTEEKNKKFTRNVYNYSSFSRCFLLPGGIKQENIEAKFENGVLKIALPRKEPTKKPGVKKIALK